MMKLKFAIAIMLAGSMLAYAQERQAATPKASLSQPLDTHSVLGGSFHSVLGGSFVTGDAMPVKYFSIADRGNTIFSCDITFKCTYQNGATYASVKALLDKIGGVNQRENIPFYEALELAQKDLQIAQLGAQILQLQAQLIQAQQALIQAQQALIPQAPPEWVLRACQDAEAKANSLGRVGSCSWY